MIAHRNLYPSSQIVSATGTLSDRLRFMFDWYKGMVDENIIRAQRTTGCIDRERGGFGQSLAVREQRIDVAGHVTSGFMKSLENGIDRAAT